jgi:hypothetical protein
MQSLRAIGRVAAYLTFAALTLVVTGCVATSPQASVQVGSTGTSSNSNPMPALSAINPSSATAGSSATTLTATGTNFISSSVVMWNGSPLSTTYTNATTLTAQVPATDLASSGTAMVSVVTPAPGGGTSSGATFTIESASNPSPSLTSISPTSATAGSSAITLTATGTVHFIFGHRMEQQRSDDDLRQCDDAHRAGAFHGPYNRRN